MGLGWDSHSPPGNRDVENILANADDSCVVSIGDVKRKALNGLTFNVRIVTSGQLSLQVLGHVWDSEDTFSTGLEKGGVVLGTEAREVRGRCARLMIDHSELRRKNKEMQHLPGQVQTNSHTELDSQSRSPHRVQAGASAS